MKAKAQSTGIACVILAAGKGTRMRSARHKVMHEIARKPMLSHVVDGARALHPARIIVVTSPDMGEVRTRLKQQYKGTVESVVQPEQKGTGDAVKAAAGALKGFEGVVLVLYGDTPMILPETMKRGLEALKANPKAALAVLGMEIDIPNAYGRLVLDKKGDLERIVEAQDASAKEKALTLCNSGVMAIQSSALPLLAKLTARNAKKEYYLTDLAELVRKEGKTCVVAKADAGELLGVNSRAELACAEAHLQRRLRRQAMESGVTLLDPASVYLCTDTKLGRDVIIHPHVVFGPGVEVAHDVEIRSFCHIEGARIGAKAIIGPFARLRPGAVIGEEAHIGNFVEIKQATIARGAKANHLSYIGDAEVGEDTNIGAGTITANYDGFHKHRTVIGAQVSVGSDTVLVAPVTIGDGAVIGAGSTITEDVEPNSLAIARAPQKQKPGWAKAFRTRKHH